MEQEITNSTTAKMNSFLIVFGSGITNIGDTMFMFAINWWIISVTNNAALLGSITASIFVPKILLNFFGGSIADSFNKKKILIVLDSINGLICLLFSVLVSQSTVSIPLVIATNVGLSLCQAIYNPAVRSILPELVPSSGIDSTNSSITTVNQAVSLLAPLLGGALVASSIITIKGFGILNAFSYFLSAISEIFLKNNHGIVKKTKSTQIFTRIRSGIQYTFSNSTLLRLLIVSAFFNLFVTGYNLSLPVLARHLSGHGNTYSLFLAFEAAGGILGAYTLRFFKDKHSIKSLKISLILCGISLVPSAIFHSQIPLMIMFAFFSFFLSRFNVAFMSYVQNTIDRQYMGRVLSVVFTVAMVFMPIGSILFGKLLQIVPFLVLPVVGCALFAVVIFLPGTKMKNN